LNDEVQQGEPHRSDASSASGVSREVAPGAGSLGDGERRPGELNESQKRRLSITCEYIDKLLRDAEHILHAEASQSPFRRYLVDVNPVQVRVLEDYTRRLRDQLLRALAWQQLRPKPPEIPATRAVLTNLNFVDSAIEELRPDYMRGSGPVPDDASDELNGVVHELRTIVEGMERYLRTELSTNLQQRLQNLEQAGQDVGLLRVIEEIVTRHGLVEFRQRIASLAARLEDDNLEVALFGRVSSGKSSLLNALLGMAILPVGVNPITAVPTKLRYGPAPRAAVSYGDGRSETVTVDDLARLVTEQGNPGNLRNVVHALVEVPSERLRQGIVLVDTPGLGSLAKKGAAETLAYLPQCDLALLLIDAGTTLNEEDLGTLRLLCESGIPALVLLSKTDLLAEEDLRSVSAYIQSQIREQLDLVVAVHAVSAMPGYSALLDRFFAAELLPRFEQARSLRRASMARKIGALRESVTAALETVAERGKSGESVARVDSQEIEARLRLITGEIGELGTSLDHAILEFAETPEAVIREVAEKAASRVQKSGSGSATGQELAEWARDIVLEFLNRCAEQMRGAGLRAVEALEQVAEEMGRSDAPTSAEIEALLRGAPRLELTAGDEDVNLPWWRWLGKPAVRAMVQSKVRRSVGPTLKVQLHLYGHALSQWTRLTVQKMQILVSSYADAGRVQLHRMTGVSAETADLPHLEGDLASLRNWGAEEQNPVTQRA
jgi:GTP-binding protein EngB required for normal cell division